MEIGFKKFIRLDEANLGSSPDNYPPGSLVMLNKNKELGSYKARDVFEVVEISKSEKKVDIDLTNGKGSALYITLRDSKDNQFTIRIGKTKANQYFLKGGGTGGKKTSRIGGKELSPDGLGLAGQTLTTREIYANLRTALKIYDEEIQKDLLYLAKKANTRSDSISLDGLNFTEKEYKTISKDYGEVLCAIWSMKSLHFKTAMFPVASNEPLVDFYANRFGVPYPISVKSGAGSKVTIGNILNGIKKKLNDPVFMHTLTSPETDALEVLRSLNILPMRDGMVSGHKIMNTAGIKKLSQIIAIPLPSLDNNAIDNWLKDKDNQEIKTALEPFYKAVGSKPSDKMWETTRSKNRFIIGPLGESLKRVLNDNKSMQSVLNKMAQQLTLIQMNIDVNSRKMIFKTAKFKESKFQFGWSGFSGGNKMGFIMVK